MSCAKADTSKRAADVEFAFDSTGFSVDKERLHGEAGSNFFFERINADTLIAQRASRDGSDETRLIDDMSERAIVGGQEARAEKLEPGDLERIELIGEGVELFGREGVLDELDIDEFGESGRAERERWREAHLRLRIVPLRIVDGQTDAPKEAGEEPNQVEMAVVGHLPELSEAHANAYGLALALMEHWTTVDESTLVSRERLAPLKRPLCTERAEMNETLLPHLLHITGDTAVITDQLLLIRLGFFDIGRMDEGSLRLSARRAQAIFDGAAILPCEEALFEADADVIPRQASVDWQSGEGLVRIDAGPSERLVPEFELEVFIPTVKARALVKCPLDGVGDFGVAAGDHSLEERASGVMHLD